MTDANRTWLVHDMLRAERQGTRLETSRDEQIACWIREHAEALRRDARPKPGLLDRLTSHLRQPAAAGEGRA